MPNNQLAEKRGCPFCGSERRAYRTVGRKQAASCHDCGASGPLVSPAKADLAWDTRASLAGEERASVVTWLRGPAFASRHPEDAAFARHVATAIEQGQHMGGSDGLSEHRVSGD